VRFSIPSAAFAGHAARRRGALHSASRGGGRGPRQSRQIDLCCGMWLTERPWSVTLSLGLGSASMLHPLGGLTASPLSCCERHASSPRGRAARRPTVAGLERRAACAMIGARGPVSRRCCVTSSPPAGLRCDCRTPREPGYAPSCAAATRIGMYALPKPELVACWCCHDTTIL